MAGTWLETAAHLADHVIPPVPVRQWVISVPKRLRCFLADRPAAVRALTKIFLAEIERLLCAAAGVTINADALPATHPRLGAVSFLHRFGSATNRHVHLHVCATDGVFVPTGAAPPAFLQATCLPKTVARTTDHSDQKGDAALFGTERKRAASPFGTEKSCVPF